jgi:cell division protein FtsB
MSEKKSFVVDEAHLQLLDEIEDDDDRDVRSRSEALRAILNEYEQLRTENERLRTRNESLENQIETLIQDRQQTKELVEYVEETRTAQRIQWLKWGLFGRRE